MTRTRRFLRVAAFALGGGLGLLALALGAAWGLMQSEPGRGWLVSQLEAGLSTPGERELTIGALEAGLPQTIKASGLKLGDGQGTWLEVASLELTWRPWQLLGGTLWIESLAVEDLKVARAPQGPAATDETAPPFELPRLPVRLVLERLSVEDVSLAAPLLGAPAAFRIAGNLRSQDTQALGLTLAAERSDGTPGRLSLEANYGLADRQLTLSLEAAEPPGGVIARALALPDLPAVEARLSGAGLLSDWGGKLDLVMPGLASAGAELTLRQAEELAFSAVGQLESQRDLADLPWRLLAGRTTFELTGRWQDPDRLSLSRGRIENGAGQIALQGSLALDSLTADLALEARLTDGALLAEFLPEAAGRDLALTAQLRGPPDAAQLLAELTAEDLALADVVLDGLKLRLEAAGDLRQAPATATLSAERLALAPYSLTGVTLKAQFDPAAPLDQGLPRGRFEAEGRVAGLPLDSLPELKALFEPAVQWRAQGRIDLADRRLDLQSASAASGLTSLEARGELEWASGDGQITAAVALADLAPLGALAGLPASGRGRLTAIGSLRGFGAAFDLQTSGQLEALAVDLPALQALLTSQVDFVASAKGGSGAPFTLKGAKIESPNITVSATASLPADFSALQATYQVAMPNLAHLEAVVGQPLAGALGLEGTAAGDPANPSLKGRVTLREGRIATLGLAKLALDYQAEDPAGEMRAQLGVEATTSLGPLAGGAQLRLLAERLEVTEIELASGATRAGGRASLPLGGGPVTATVTAESTELGRWLALTGQKGGGRATAEIALSGEAARQDVVARVKLNKLALEAAGLTIDDMTADLALQDLLGAPRGQVALAGKKLAAGALALERFQAAAKGTPADLALDLTAQGDWSGPLDLMAKARLGLGEAETRVELSQLKGQLLGQALHSQRPAQFTLGSGQWRVAGLELRWGAARLAAAGQLGQETLALDLTLQSPSLADWQSLLPIEGAEGQLEAEVILTGTPAKPRGTLAAQLTDLILAEMPQADPADFTLRGDWASGRLALDGRLEGLAEQPATLVADLPLRFDPATFEVSLPQRDPASGAIKWRGQLAEIWPWVPLVGHDLEGEGALDLTLAGSLAQPQLDGRLTVEQGSYENYQTGTLLRDLALVVNLEGSRAVIQSLTANDGGSGKLQALGRVDLDPERGFPFNLTAKMKKFTALRRDDVSGSGDAKLSFAGSQDSARLSGRLETRRVEIRIPDRLPGEIVELEVTEVGAEQEKSTGGGAATVEQQIALDMDLVLPNQVFLRGRGLDSEWAGRIAVGGTAAQPRLKGKLTLVRGEISILSKTFALESGKVDLLGGPEIDPLLEVKAVNQGPDLTVTIAVSGPLSDPDIILSSSPELPQDEIVARLLFGRSTTKLSALEAVQLAAAVGELTGQTGGPGILDFTRDTLGVDVLKVESGKSGAAVSAGKYLRQDVYVGVKQGLTADSGAVEVEVEVTPNISIESEVGQTGDSNVGIKFKWDY